MTELLIIAFGSAFLFGLVQWARSGAILWDVVKFSGPKLRRSRKTDEDEESGEESGEESRREKEALRELESMADRLLRSSFRVLGILALCVWLFVIASVVFDLLGLDWADRLSFHANRLWGDPSVRSVRSASQSGTNSNSVLRSLGSGLRK